MLTKDHTVLPATATHTFIHKWNEPMTVFYSSAAVLSYGIIITEF